LVKECGPKHLKLEGNLVAASLNVCVYLLGNEINIFITKAGGSPQ